jgi:FKBP-type peptidyl-prolyl cis-trans isomerase
LVTIGDKDQIKMWVEAVPGMKVGEIRRLTVPSELGYGAKGRPPAVPPNATLVFEVELIDIL